jgi:hypothetical protein
MAPDNSYMVTGMCGSHEEVRLYRPDGSSRDISVVPPGIKPLKNGGRGVMWNPKWEHLGTVIIRALPPLASFRLRQQRLRQDKWRLGGPTQPLKTARSGNRISCYAS